MNQGYIFLKLPCPYCDRLIGANWLVRHLKQAHDGEQCNVEEPTAEDLREERLMVNWQF